MDHTRHIGIYTIPDLARFDVIGCGGIGSIAAVTLGKMGVHYVTLHDGDRVETVNVATQLHPVSGIGNLKVDSTAELCEMFSDDIYVQRSWNIVDQNTKLNGNVIISAVDSINARKDIWKAAVGSNGEWYLDARMSAEVFHLYVVNMLVFQDNLKYDTDLAAVNEEDVPEIVCTEKATFYTACMAAGHIGAAVKRIFTGSQKSYHLIHYIAKNVIYELNI